MWFVYGNIQKEIANQLVDQSIKSLELESQPKSELNELMQIDITQDRDHFQRLDFDVVDEANENACLCTYYQYGRDDEDGR